MLDVERRFHWEQREVVQTKEPGGRQAVEPTNLRHAGWLARKNISTSHGSHRSSMLSKDNLMVRRLTYMPCGERLVDEEASPGNWQRRKRWPLIREGRSVKLPRQCDGQPMISMFLGKEMMLQCDC